MHIGKLSSKVRAALLIFLLLIAAIVIWALARPEKIEGLPEAPKGSFWKKVFSDEFEGTNLDESKWVRCYVWYSKDYGGCSNDGNEEQEWYVPEQVSVQDGYVRLTAIREDTKGWNSQKKHEQTYPFKSGMISTGKIAYGDNPKWAGEYGYFEARMRMTDSQGVWPAFWLLPEDHSWPPEIDIMELLGHKPDEILMTYHWPGKTPQKDYSIYKGADFTQDWHTFAVNWQPGKIDWYIDGALRKSATSDNVASKDMEILFNLAIGGKLPGNADSTTEMPAHTDIDYIRVYSLR